MWHKTRTPTLQVLLSSISIGDASIHIPPLQMRSLLANLTAIALSSICLPLKAAFITTVDVIPPFTAVVTQVNNIYDPQGTLYQPPIPPVVLGDIVRGSFSVSSPSFPGASSTLALTLSNGRGWAGHEGGIPGSVRPGLFQFGHETALQGVGISLYDPAGGTNWQSGSVSASDRSGYPYSWWSFSANIITLPDGGPTGGMLCAVFAVLLLIRRGLASPH